MKNGFYMTTSSVVGPRSSKALSKATLAPKKKKKKKIMVTFWWSAACLIHYNFLNPAKPLHLRVCAGNRLNVLKTATPAAGIGQQKGPDSSL